MTLKTTREFTTAEELRTYLEAIIADEAFIDRTVDEWVMIQSADRQRVRDRDRPDKGRVEQTDTLPESRCDDRVFSRMVTDGSKKLLDALCKQHPGIVADFQLRAQRGTTG